MLGGDRGRGYMLEGDRGRGYMLGGVQGALTVMYSINLSVCLSAVIHSLKYFYTASSGVSNMLGVCGQLGCVDELQIIHWEGNSQKAGLKQAWEGTGAPERTHNAW